MKKQNGITLIALVITIVVLLILAAVSINAILGDNGILNRASQSKEETNKAIRKEYVQNALNAVITDGLTADKLSSSNYDAADEWLKSDAEATTTTIAGGKTIFASEIVKQGCTSGTIEDISGWVENSFENKTYGGKVSINGANYKWKSVSGEVTIEALSET